MQSAADSDKFPKAAQHVGFAACSAPPPATSTAATATATTTSTGTSTTIILMITTAEHPHHSCTSTLLSCKTEQGIFFEV